MGSSIQNYTRPCIIPLGGISIWTSSLLYHGSRLSELFGLQYMTYRFIASFRGEFSILCADTLRTRRFVLLLSYFRKH